MFKNDMDNQDYFYVTEVEKDPKSVFCFYDLINESVVPEHEHSKSQLIYTEGGVVHIKTDKKTYFLPARHYMWIPAGVRHSIYSSNMSVKGRNFYFPINFSKTQANIEEGIYPVDDLLLQIMMYTSSWYGDVIKSDRKRYPIFETFMILLEENVGKKIPLALPRAQDERLRKIQLHLGENLIEPIVLKDLAKHYGFTERTLQRLFMKDLGMTFIQYFTILRMLKAIEFLLNEKIPVNEIASRVGYSSTSTFSNTFFKIIGKRPSEYFNQIDKK